MARVLHEFQANTKAIASEVNENFAAVQEDINDMGSALDTYFKAELTKTKEDILTDFEEAKTTKLNVDLSNISNEAKEKIIYYGMPDYKAGITKTLSTTYTAEKDGIIVLSVTGAGNSAIDVEMYVDGVLINESDSWMRDGSQGWSCWGLVPKGSTYRVISDFSGTLKFYPMKGAV